MQCLLNGMVDRRDRSSVWFITNMNSVHCAGRSDEDNDIMYLKHVLQTRIVQIMYSLSCYLYCCCFVCFLYKAFN